MTLWLNLHETQYVTLALNLEAQHYFECTDTMQSYNSIFIWKLSVKLELNLHETQHVTWSLNFELQNSTLNENTIYEVIIQFWLKT